MAIITGVIADDFTGATDIASFMAEQGWRVVLLTGMPDESQRWITYSAKCSGNDLAGERHSLAEGAGVILIMAR